MDEHDDHTRDGHGHHGHHHVDFGSPGMVAFAELEGEVFLPLVADAIAELAGLCDRYGVAVRRVLDVGCGPGVATCCLAERFGSASVVAVDGSAPMLERVAARAERLGVERRVETRLAELPAELDALDRADVVWASMVLHHLGDETAALRRIRGLVGSGGLLAIVERSGPFRVLPGNAALGRPGLWERLDAAWEAWFEGMRAELPGTTPSAAYPAMLRDAGFELVDERVLSLAIDAPLGPQERRLAHRHLQGARTQLDRHADAADLEALDVLLDEGAEDGIMKRGDAVLRSSRLVFVARVAPGATPA